MVFSSTVFMFIFLPIVLIISYLLPRKLRNVFLLLANLIFYAYGEPVYVILMVCSIIFNYIFGLTIQFSRKKWQKLFMLVFAIVLNISTLCYFKYTNLIIKTLHEISAFSDLKILDIVLPIGISFYTFQAVSYIIDVYRGECRATKNIINFASYISLFPQLIAGPIVRYVDVERDLLTRKISMSDFSDGVRLFVCGLSKKILLANQFGILWNNVNENILASGTIGAWIGAIAYTLQIYFDFGGYSDMARGLGKMLGFDFCINFNYPYISKSITEFWRRWHISLSTWFRDYLYIPLGGNRVGKIRLCINLLLVWILTGLWHGAGWNFVAWGLYYGILLIAEKFILKKLLSRFPSIVCHIYTILGFVVGWIIFAADTFKGALNYLSVMFTIKSGSMSLVIPWIITIAVGAFAATPCFSILKEKLVVKKCYPVAECIVCLIALVLCTASLISDSYNPFLYFRF